VNPYTIGAVLEQLRGEFTDLTISKIRYLEDQGLVEPQRTPSGYRKYRDRDVARLRWALRVQRDRYLPLKVIREELERLGDRVIDEVAAADGAVGHAEVLPAGLAVAPEEDQGPPVEPLNGFGRVAGDGGWPEQADAEGVTTTPSPGGAPAMPDHPVTLRELADLLDVDAGVLRSLRDNGLLPDQEPYQPHDARVARWSVKLLEVGLEPRHLRMYPQFADREAALVEQLLLPLQRQRNPQSRARAADLATDVAEAGARLHAALLSRTLHDLLEGGAG